MSKAIKLKNDTYLDSSSIVHNRQKLSDVLNKEVYSFDETVIGTWVNGKPLYRKVIVGEIDYNKYVEFAMQDVDRITRLDGFLMNTTKYNHQSCYPLPYYENSNMYVAIGYSSLSKKIGIRTGSSNYAAGSYSITIEYTKTTD